MELAGRGLRAGGATPGGAATLDDRQAFDATAAGPYPDIFYRVATAFTHPAARFPADVLLSMPDDVASYGFAVPGAVVDIRAADGFHGACRAPRRCRWSRPRRKLLPPAVRSDELADMFPALAGVR